MRHISLPHRYKMIITLLKIIFSAKTFWGTAQLKGGKGSPWQGLAAEVCPTTRARSRAARRVLGLVNSQSYLNVVDFQGAISGNVEPKHGQGTGCTA